MPPQAIAATGYRRAPRQPYLPPVLHIDPATLPTADLYQYLIGIVGPRPIAFVSTVNEAGHANLAPYSFFNLFSSNPPILVFSSNRRVADNTTKDTLANVRATGECVVNVVSHSIVRQMAVASVEWPTEVSEFEASGLTPLASELVRPPRVAESPASMECRVRDIITLGEGGGAGHLILCDIVRVHIDETVIDERGRVDPHKIDLMGRMGRSYYVRASGDAILSVVQPVNGEAIGFMALPQNVRESRVLTGNDLGRLAGAPAVPAQVEIEKLKAEDPQLANILASSPDVDTEAALHVYAKALLERDEVMKALMVVMAYDGVRPLPSGAIED